MILKINKKLLFFVLTIIFLILAIFTIQSTFARYVTSLTASSSIELGTWSFSINNQNIMENSDISNTVVPTFNEGSEYIASGVVAPTSTGFVEIDIDYSKVNVPFKYDISVTTEETSPLEDFTLTSYSIDDGELVTVTSSDAVITDTILPADALRTRRFKLNFEWYDGAGENFNDFQDTAYYMNNTGLALRFDISFTQLQPTT